MHRFIFNTVRAIFLASISHCALANDGTLQFSGAVTTPNCQVVLAPKEPSPARIDHEGPGCQGTGNVGTISLETVGEPQDGLAIVTLEVF
jgi:type 1 fimbria pilin